MASLCNPLLCSSVPAKIAKTSGFILPTAPLSRDGAQLFYTVKKFPGPLKVIQSQKYVYPDPMPEFAAAETMKFKDELLKKLSKEKDTFGNDLQTVVGVCGKIFSKFLHKEYGGPGTLLIEPFTDMMVALKEENLPGAPLAARASLLWAQNYVDQDWEDWNSKSHK